MFSAHLLNKSSAYKPFLKAYIGIPNTFGKNILFQSLNYKLCLAHLFSPPNTLHEKKILSYVKDILLAN